MRGTPQGWGGLNEDRLVQHTEHSPGLMVRARAARNFMKEPRGTTGRPGNQSMEGRGGGHGGPARVHRQMEECGSRHRRGKGWLGTERCDGMQPWAGGESKGQAQGAMKRGSGCCSQATVDSLHSDLCWEGRSRGCSAGRPLPLQRGPVPPRGAHLPRGASVLIKP